MTDIVTAGLPDEFLWPGTTVPRNKLGLRDIDDFERAASALTLGRLVELRLNRPVPGRYDLSHLRAIHAYLFGGLYDWAGQPRTHRLRRGQLELCRPENLRVYAKGFFDRLDGKEHLKGLPTSRFVADAAELLCDLTMLSLFPGGNGVASRAFVELLSDDAGQSICWPADARQRAVSATDRALRGDETALRALLAESLDR